MTRIGWIGTGVMGRSMCQHLMTAGHTATVFNRTREKAQALVDAGATWAESPRAVAEASDVIFLMVGFPSEVAGVLTTQQGVFAGARSGTIVVDMSTSDPSLAIGMGTLAEQRGVGYLDAPVSGGDIGARNATLSIMVGGDAATFERVRPLFEKMGKTIVLQGPLGAGQHTKMVNQILIATNMIGVCEALLYARKAGLDPRVVLSSVGGGAAASWSLSNLAPRILDRNFEPGFFVEHFIKDLGIALAEARRMQLALPGLALAEQLYLSVQANGLGKKGTHALMLALEKMSNVGA
jgi:3-hydroxyisobutyrate dehydrogenase